MLKGKLWTVGILGFLAVIGAVTGRLIKRKNKSCRFIKRKHT